MIGSSASSVDRHSGHVLVYAELELDPTPEALELVEVSLNAFVEGLAAGYFHPAALGSRAPLLTRPSPTLFELSCDVYELPLTAINVLGGVLHDASHYDAKFRSATAHVASVNAPSIHDLLVETKARPHAVPNPPFQVEFSDALGDNDALLIEIEFARAVPAEVGDELLRELRLWDILGRAYPPDWEEDTAIGGQQHFNDPHTIHHYEWVCEARPEAWNLLVNLCCKWHQREPVIRLRIE